MGRILLILTFVFNLGQAYPLVYAQLGTPLYKVLEPMSQFEYVESLENQVKAYTKEANKTMQEGYLLDNSIDKNKIKKYLKSLRKLQKSYDYFLHLIHQNINKSIAKKNYKDFLEFTKYEYKGLLQNSNIRVKAIAFYNKNKSKQQIKLFEKIIKTEKIIKETEIAFYIQPVKATYSSKSKKVQSKKSVYVETNQKDKNIEVVFFNKNLYDVTIKMQSKYTNIRESKDTRKTLVVKAKSSKKYTTLTLGEGKTSYQYSYSWIIGSKNAKHDDSYIYRLPFEKGTSCYVSQGFNGKSTHKGHSAFAIDFAMKEGTKVYSARNGTIVRTKFDSNRGGYAKKFSKYGNFITILHSDGTFATYYHLKQNGVLVHVGDKVPKGYHIGYSGNTGYSSGPHLHFAVFKAANSKTTKSLPIVFSSLKGIVREPIVGRKYTAI